MNCLLLRYGEIALKSKSTRIRLENLYVNAIKEALARNKVEITAIKNLGGRFVIKCKDPSSLIQIVTKVPGVQSVSPATSFNFSSTEALLQKAKKVCEPLVKNKIFCIKVKRVGKHNFTSMELAKELGSQVYKYSRGVKLTNPEIEINLEVRDQEAFVYSTTHEAVGGLPTQKNDKALCLFSGGIDSPVAALQMLKRGCAVDFLHINFLGEKSFQQVAQIYNFLIHNYAFNYKPTFYLIDGRKLVKKIQEKVPDSLKQIAVKIIFYRIAEEIAKQEKHLALITGEALSQKSSQTLKSLALINTQTVLPVLRPLLGMNKIEIVERARSIGTLTSSEKVKEFCNLSLGKVATAPKTKDLEKIPSFDQEILEAVNNVKKYVEKIEIRDVDSEIPSLNNLIKVDIRNRSLQEKEPLPVELSLPYPDVFEYDFDKNKKYLIICDFGVKSEDVAHELRKKGIRSAGVTVKNYLRYFK